MRTVVFAFALTLPLSLTFTPSARAEEPHPLVAVIKAKLKETDKPFTMLVTVKVKPGMQAKFEAAFAEAIKGTRKEKGNLVYQLNQSTEDDTTYAIYERWKNLDALAEHLKAGYITTLLAALPDLLDGEPKFNVGVPRSE